MVVMPWSWDGSKLEEIPLTIHRHCGHLQKQDAYYIHDMVLCHPQNLLDGNGIGTQYCGTEPAVDDWIIFKFGCPFIVIPKIVIIRNDDSQSGLKAISLSLSVYGDKFEDFAVIQGILNQRDKEQHFELKDSLLSYHEIWTKRYKYIKMEMRENWGDVHNAFHSFAVIGTTMNT